MAISIASMITAAAAAGVRAGPGMMVLFPSYMQHAVLAHEGVRQRISIAFNLRREPFP